MIDYTSLADVTRELRVQLEVNTELARLALEDGARIKKLETALRDILAAHPDGQPMAWAAAIRRGEELVK